MTTTNEAKKIEGAQVFDSRTMVLDGYDNFITRVGLNNDNQLSAGFYVLNLMTNNRVQLEAAYRGSWVVGQIIECTAEDMTRAGVSITTNESEEDINDFKSAQTKLGIWGSICDNIKWGDLYGGSIAVLQIKGQRLDTPLNLDTIAQGQFTGLTVYDRWQLQPVLDQVIQEGSDIGLPAYYDIVTTAATTSPNATAPVNPLATGQIRVHHSRCIRASGIKLPFFQAITQQMWGESKLERLWDRLIAFDNTTMSAANLVERANNRTIGVENLREILAAGGKAQQAMEKQFSMMRMFQNNEGLTLMDKEDTFQTTNYTFSGLSDVLLQFGQQLAGASQIPLVRLFGQSPSGLNSTGESDLRIYYDGINAKQVRNLTAGVDLILRVLWRSTFGKPEPKDFQFTFEPLWQTSDKDKSEIAKANTETILAVEEQGLIKRSTALKELRDKAPQTGLFSNITDEEIDEADDVEPPSPEEINPDPEDPTKRPGEETVKQLDHKPVRKILDRLKKVGNPWR